MADHAVTVVGAGFAGLAAAFALRKRGVDDIVIVERADQVGGTWRDNVYPGLACDVPSHLYCFADHPNPYWSREFAPGWEIQHYLVDIATSTGVIDLVRFGTPLQGARWTGGEWEVTVGAETRTRFTTQSLILACGRLTEPRIPDIDGMAAFPGRIVHTARWDDRVDVAGVRVAVAGTGASAVQIVPALVARGAEVVLFQRSPAWILPRGGRVYSESERTRWAEHPERLADLRQELYRQGEQRFASRSGNPEAARIAGDAAAEHLRTQVADESLRTALTPSYPFGCKRVLLSDDFYPAVASDAVTFEPARLVAVRGDELHAANGAVHRADMLVLATGFHTTRQPYARLVEGANGLTLDEHWSGGMTSLGSTLVTGFPDLYILNGPNAALGHNSSILMLEEQADFVARSVGSRTEPVAITPGAEAAYTAEIVQRSAGTPWVAPGCTSWYVDERSGRLTLLWPGTVESYRERLARIGPDDFVRVPA